MAFRDKFGHQKDSPERAEREDAPPAVRKLLLDLMEERAEWDADFDPYEVVCDALGEVPSETWGNERRNATRRAVDSRLDWPDVYELISRVADNDQEERINRVLASAGIGYEYYSREFHVHEPAADELEIAGIESQALAPSLDPDKRFAAPLAQYRKAVAFLRSMPPDLPNAVASAVNALEGTVRVVTGTRSMSEGVKKLYAGERTTLGKSIEMLFNFGSAMDGVRHGAVGTDDALSIHEATFVVRAAGSAIAYLITAESEGLLGSASSN